MIRRLTKAIEPYVWWTVRRFRPVHRIEGLDFIDVRMDEAGSDPLIRLVREAAHYLRVGHQLAFVTEQISFVAATRHPRANISVRMRSYMTPFAEYERENSFVLACKLVWAAWYIHLHRKPPTPFDEAKEVQIQARCAEEQLRFVQSVPNSEQWVHFLNTHRDG